MHPDARASGATPPAVPAAYQQPWPNPSPHNGPARPIVALTPKSPGIAVLLNVLWLGAGNLYVNQIGLGIALFVVDFFLAFFFFLLLWTVIVPILIVPVWVVMFALAAATSASAAITHNHGLGIS